MVRSIQTAAFAAYLVSFASAVAVTPRESFKSVPFKKRVGEKVSVKALVQHGQARLKGLSSIATDVVGSAPAINELVSYVAPTVVGTQTFNLIVDTYGSSNTWVGANTKYVKSSSGTSLGKSVSVSYGSGLFFGTEYTDKVTLGGLTVPKQSVGVAAVAIGFNGVDGILGVGPVVLTQGTVSGTKDVPTFLDNLKSQGTISSEVLGVYFAPESGTDTDDENGVLTLGGVDTSKYIGTLNYVPKSATGNFGYYWGITIASVKYGSTSLLGSNGAIGTTLIYLPTSAYNAFLSATGGKTDSTQGIPAFSAKPAGTIIITIGSVGYTLTPDQYLVPTAEYSLFGLSSGRYYAWIGDGGSSGVDAIIGQKFLENYYSVYDTTKSRIGLATRA